MLKLDFLGILSLFRKAKPWLKENYEEEVFELPLSYLIQHLDQRDLAKVQSHANEWQNNKEIVTVKNIKSGNTLKPINLTLDWSKHIFRVDDGISRIKAHKQLNKKVILAKVRAGHDLW